MMPDFDDVFAATRVRPVHYGGRELVRTDRFPIEGAQKLRVTFESTKSKYRQGIGVDLRKICETRVAGTVTSKKEWNVLWEDTAPKQVEIELLGPAEHALIFNVWQDLNRKPMPGSVSSRVPIEWWTNGAAMIVEEIPNGRRYRCNDGEPDDDFDDLVFRIERVTE
jgi:hypothetical protein